MLKKKKVITSFILFVFLSIFLLFAPLSNAQTNYASGQTITLPKDQTINKDYFVAGNTIILDGTVNGDVYAAGGSVMINGTVNGDVLVAGGNISVNGKVTGNVRGVGGQILVGGDIGRNVSVAGGSVTVSKTAKIAGSITAASGNLSIVAPVGKGMTFAGGQTTIDSSIGGDVTGAARQLTVLPESSILGKLTYWSNNQAQISTSSVRGGVVYHHTNWDEKNQKAEKKESAAAFAIIWWITGILMSFVMGLFLLTFVPLFTKNVYDTIIMKPWESLGIGFVTVILLPFAFILLLMTIVGIPLAFILLMVFIIVALLNGIFVSYTIGKKILPQKNILALLLGIVINGIISVIPFIGWIWSLITFFISVGALVLVKKELYTTLRKQRLI